MDDSIVGRTGAPFTMAVEVGKIREFARATKSDNPEYQGGPGDRPVTPGTFLVTSSFWQTPEANPLAGVPETWPASCTASRSSSSTASRPEQATCSSV